MKIEPGRYYHIYNRGINSREIFFSDRDFERFLDKYIYYLGLSVKTFAYCLMNNHFHFLLKVLSIKAHQRAIATHRKFKPNQASYILPNPENRLFKIEQLLSHLFNSHTRYINSKYNRTGSLWDANFKVREIDSDEYLQQCICYIHRNPIHHGLTNSYKAYPYSSFKEVLLNNNIIVDSSATLVLFGNRENFEAAHQEVKNTLEPYYRLE